jgi:hypothetical protein
MNISAARLQVCILVAASLQLHALMSGIEMKT